MKTIKLKVTDFDESSNSLIVSFASDTTQSSNPDDYNGLAFQPHQMWPDETNMHELVEKIAFAGIHIAKNAEIQEQIANNQEKINNYKSLVGRKFEFDIEYLSNKLSGGNSSDNAQ